MQQIATAQSHPPSLMAAAATPANLKVRWSLQHCRVLPCLCPEEITTLALVLLHPARSFDMPCYAGRENPWMGVDRFALAHGLCRWTCWGHIASQSRPHPAQPSHIHPCTLCWMWKMVTWVVQVAVIDPSSLGQLIAAELLLCMCGVHASDCPFI